MELIKKELINKEKLQEKISELEQNYIAGIFQDFYFPIQIEAVAKEIVEMESNPDITEEEKEGIEERKKMIKTHEMALKSVRGTIENLNKTIPYLKSYVDNE